MPRFTAASLLFLPLAALADDVGFVARCEKMAREAKVEVVFEDRPVTRDDTRSIEDLKRRSQPSNNPNHSILGLTHAVSTISYDINSRILSEPNGRVCVIPSLNVKLGFTSFEVYIAREVNTGCKRKIVDDHEQEHVAIWRNHFRAGARMLTTVLQREFNQPLYYTSQTDLKIAVRQRIDGLITPLFKNLQDGITAAHQQIDSPASYQYEDKRLRACH